MNRIEIAAAVESAIDELIEKQPELLALDVTERALSHHLAIHMRERMPAHLDIDVEYNRHGADPKRLQLPRRDALDRELRATTVFPDIIVHKRNTDENNLLVLEMKKPGENIDYDELKLRAFREELGYRYGAHVILGRDVAGDIVRQVVWIDG
jgi:hypothetical protein